MVLFRKCEKIAGGGRNVMSHRQFDDRLNVCHRTET